MDADQRELLDERIAIMVIDGGLDQAEAERRAREYIERVGAVHEPPAPSAPEQMHLIEPSHKAELREFYKKR